MRCHIPHETYADCCSSQYPSWDKDGLASLFGMSDINRSREMTDRHQNNPTSNPLFQPRPVRRVLHKKVQTEVPSSMVVSAEQSEQHCFSQSHFICSDLIKNRKAGLEVSKRQLVLRKRWKIHRSIKVLILYLRFMHPRSLLRSCSMRSAHRTLDGVVALAPACAVGHTAEAGW